MAIQIERTHLKSRGMPEQLLDLDLTSHTGGHRKGVVVVFFSEYLFFVVKSCNLKDEQQSAVCLANLEIPDAWETHILTLFDTVIIIDAWKWQ